MMGKPHRERSTDPRKPRNITLDADVAAELWAVQDELEGSFGFRPSLSQTLKHLIRSKR